jgi:hypothetical protein
MGSSVRSVSWRPRSSGGVSEDHIDLEANKLGRERIEAIKFVIGKSPLDGQILSFNVAKLAQALAQHFVPRLDPGAPG